MMPLHGSSPISRLGVALPSADRALRGPYIKSKTTSYEFIQCTELGTARLHTMSYLEVATMENLIQKENGTQGFGRPTRLKNKPIVYALHSCLVLLFGQRIV